MKNKTGIIVAIVALLCLAGGLIAAMVFGIKHFGFSNFNFGGSNNVPLALEKDFNYETVKKIKTASDAADVKFIKSSSEDNKINVKIYASEDKTINAEGTGDSISVEVRGRCIGFCWNNSSRIEITLPESYEGDFEIQTDAGDIKSDSFSKANFNINADAGDIEIASAKNVTITTNAGDIALGDAAEISIDTNAGDIDINKCTNKLHISANAGDIKINELQLVQNSDIKTDAGDITINNAGDIYIDADTDFGDVNVKNNDHFSDIELKINTNAGDIHAN